MTTDLLRLARYKCECKHQKTKYIQLVSENEKVNAPEKIKCGACKERKMTLVKVEAYGS